MSKIGKLYRFYLGKIWQKNWGRILVFTILIGVVWWFVLPWAAMKAFKGAVEAADSEEFQNLDPETRRIWDRKHSFSDGNRLRFGAWKNDRIKKSNRETIKKYVKKLEEGDEEVKNWGYAERLQFWSWRSADNGGSALFSTPWSADNAFFFSQTEGYNKMGEKSFWQMLFNISWWNLSGFVVLYWFIFEVLDKTFFSPRREGEEESVLIMTPGVKRSDIIWGKIFAFLTFYFLINIVLFLIPFGIYYWWLASKTSFPWFALLTLITTIVGPILFFGLIFAPYLFLGSWLGSSKWIFSTLISFFPLLWGGLKLLTSMAWPYKVESVFFAPIWFTIISLVCGIFFLTLYYLRYQEEDLN
ncbi:MAG: hypothetical protein MRERV_1c026 [Mycoplasmataceae bacterium RV_VA103A]|nr:MAG: hypothetical protein MRERV_1c026 [Mycoplasmataceae bacterium RV_VA103A]